MRKRGIRSTRRRRSALSDCVESGTVASRPDKRAFALRWSDDRSGCDHHLVRYEEHEVFTTPDDPDVPIWRYIDFTKLVALLERSSLFFARADTLGDTFEGSYSQSNVALRAKIYPDIPPEQHARSTSSSSTSSRDQRRSAATDGLFGLILADPYEARRGHSLHSRRAGVRLT